MLKETKVRKGKLFKQGVVEVNVPSTTTKAKQRLEIEKQVFDIPDSVADNAKMILLMLSMNMRLYEAMTDEIKDNLSDEDRVMIEYTFEKYKSIKTRMDIQFATEGIGLIDKLMDRQEKIGKVLSQ